ncbi:hypothetical protein D3C85_1383660 [compost metagenome]
MGLEIGSNGNSAQTVRRSFYFKALIGQAQLQELENMRLVIHQQQSYTLGSLHDLFLQIGNS